MAWLDLSFASIAFTAAAGFGYGAWRKIAQRRATLRIPMSATGAAAPGVVEASGRAAVAPGGAPVPARFGEGEGVMGTWVVQELRRTGKSNEWRTIHQERLHPVFAIDDGTGPLLVDVTEAELDVEPTFTAQSGPGKDPPPRVLEYLRERNVAFEGAFGVNRSLRFRETLVPVGRTLYVIGVAEPAPRGSGARTLVRGKMPDAPFVVSTRPEREVAKRAAWHAAGMAVGALLFGLAGVAVAFGLGN